MESQDPILPFSDKYIYEFKIDYYKTGTFNGNGFYEYCKVIYDTTNNDYKIYSYYSLNNKLHPTKSTKEGNYKVIKFLRVENDNFIFKGPIFTDRTSHRLGQYDEWILNINKIFEIP